MTHVSSVLALATICVAGSFAAAMAQPSELQLQQLQNSKLEMRYEPPEEKRLQPIYERLRARRVLEDLKAFLAPLRLPRKLVLRTEQCGEANAFYRNGQEKELVLCYEYVETLETLTARKTAPRDYTRAEAVVGGTVDALLHELGHAVFDLLDAPVLGREEDAADQVAAFVMLQFNRDMARTAIKGGAYYYLVTEREPDRTAFSDTHGTDRQRYYNYLCLAYGADPAAFQDFVDDGLLPKERAVHCGREYEQVRRAFVKTILPFIDQDMMKTVQAVRWIRPSDRQ